MEKLTLSCGRYAPQTGDTVEARVRAMENYLARLSEEMEFLVAQMEGLRRMTADAAREEE